MLFMSIHKMDGAKEFLTSNTFEGKTNTSHLTKRSFEIMNFEELSGFSYTFKLTCSYIPVLVGVM